jgi:Fur family transcriptional regulator, peroxide stress response regulator
MGAKDIEQSILDALRQKGMRITPQRQLIIEIISRERNHPSACMLLKKGREKLPDMSASTVYYTLGLLKKHGLVKELQFYNMDNRYEKTMAEHIDLICTRCGSIENLHGPLPITAAAIEGTTGFKAEIMRYEYYGLCKRCKEG